VNACLMRLRTRRRRPERAIEDLLPRFDGTGHAWEPSVEWDPMPEGGMPEALKATVRRCLDELPEGYRAVLVLRDIQGMDTQETAAVMGLSPNAVKTRLHRARQALRELLDPHLREVHV
jgi:RNA polymerase sigma-70 factor, ECF subfamily